MAKKSSAKKEVKQRNVFTQGLSENQRWVLGIVLFAFAVFLLIAIIFYYIYWADDQQVVENLGVFGSEGVVRNPLGRGGAKMAHYVVGEWFGLFGIVIPIVLIILALRIINYRPTILRKSVRVSLIIAILGSLTLGFIFRDKWSVFGSGLGGWHGIVVSDWIGKILGGIGTPIVLLLGWILTGFYINKKRTMTTVNRVGKGIFDGGVKVTEVVMDKASEMIHSKPQENETNEEQSVLNPYYVEDKAVEERSGAKEDEDFEVVDRRNPEQIMDEMPVGAFEEELEGSGVFEILPNKESVKPNQTKRGGGDDVVMFGEEVDEYIFRALDGTVVEYVNPRGGGIEEMGAVFEVVDVGANAPLSAGGVLEAHTAEGVRVGDTMEVVMAGRRDVELDDDQIESELYDPTKELSRYQKPPIELLEDHTRNVSVTEQEVYENKNQIVQTLENFGIKIDKIKATIGPTVTLYEIVPAPGIKISRIKNLEDDIALSLKALGIRIVAPIPGQGTVGIEVPNKDAEIVSMYSVLRTKKFQESDYELPVALGKTVSNETFMIDLVNMPHLLVAGATGQGKSVGLNAIITSLLYKKHPSELKFVMIDPKRVELSLYSRLEKHYLAKMESEEESVLTNTEKVVYTLNALCEEMSDRYDLLRMAEVRRISEYNDKFIKRRLNPKKGHRFLPYIVVIIDEFADMIMTAGREIEAPITRLAQLSRAVGIHLVIATQRPDVRVITGLIKANFPARIAFRVMSAIDSRTILDQGGANQLIGRGDMLISLNGELTRIQCAFVDTPEVERITEFISSQMGYPSAYELPDYTPEGERGDGDVDLSNRDKLFEEVATFVVSERQGSTSSIQRRFSVGYNRAGRIMDQLEAIGVVGRAEGSKPRDVLINDLDSLEYILSKLDS